MGTVISEPIVPGTIGPYHIVDVLGQGGMGIVYRARHRSTQQLVALKTVLVPDESLMQSIRREIHALARIEHPGIVKILDEGSHEGMPWYAMEYLTANTVRGYAVDLRDHRLSDVTTPISSSPPGLAPDDIEQGEETWWTRSLGKDSVQVRDEWIKTNKIAASDKPSGTEEKFLPDDHVMFERYIIKIFTLVIKICHSLSYLHGEGIVHRDLKPQNILVRADGSPVIVDFGLVAFLSSEASRDVLSGARRVSGTLLYMAPEQFRNELVDARADLYSLGIMLYEMLMGKFPFSKNRIFHIMSQSGVQEFQLPSDFDQRLTGDLDALLLRLLSPDPRFRIGYAADVAAQLHKVLHAIIPEQSVADLPECDAFNLPNRTYLYRPGFSGRISHLKILAIRLQELMAGSGGLALIGGESGVGKTRFAQQVCTLAMAENVFVMTGECLDNQNRPLEALRKPLQAIGDRCRSLGMKMSQLVFGERAALLSQYEPSLSTLPGLENQLPPPELDPAKARQRLFSYIREVFTSFAKIAPIVLLIDDMQWADSLLIDLLIHLHRTDFFDEVPILLLGTYRSDEVSSQLEKLISADHVLSLSLNRLEEDDVEHIMGDMLALYPPPLSLTQLVFRHSEGNPFFVAEILRSAVDRGIINRDRAGQWTIVEDAESGTSLDVLLQFQIPKTIYELVNRRLMTLLDNEREITERASVIGRYVTLSLLQDLCSFDETSFLHSIKELLRKQILEEVHPGFIGFVHDKIREVTYRYLDEERCRLLHGEIAAHVESLPEKQREVYLFQLGFHWERAGNLLKARQWYIEAAQAATVQNADREAEKMYRAALKTFPDEMAESVEIRMEMLRKTIVPRGKLESSRREAEFIIDQASRLNDPILQIKASLIMSNIGYLHGLPELSFECSQKIEKLQENITLADGLSAAIAQTRAMTAFARGYLEEARSYIETALVFNRKEQDNSGFLRCLSFKATILRNLGDYELAKQIFEDTIREMEESGNLGELGSVLINYGGLLTLLGQLERAIEMNTQAVEIYRKSGHVFLEACALNDLGLAYAHSSDYQKSLPLYTQALKIFHQLGNLMGQGAVHSNLAAQAFRCGDIEMVETSYLKALELYDKLGNKQQTAATRINRANLLRLKNQLEDAQRLLDSIELDEKGIDRNRTVELLFLFERGHLEIALERSAGKYIQQLRTMLDEMNSNDRRNFPELLEELEEAENLFQSDRHDALIAGSARASLPVDMLAALDRVRMTRSDNEAKKSAPSKDPDCNS